MSRYLLVLALPTLLAACDRKPEEKKSGPPPVLITVTEVEQGAFEVIEETLGTLEAVVDPKIGAEVAGRIVKVLAFAGKSVRRGEALAVIDPTDLALQSQADEADAKRLDALLAQQERLVDRQRQLVAKGFVSRNAVDDVEAQRDAVAEQLAAARARSEAGRRNVGKRLWPERLNMPPSWVVASIFLAIRLKLTEIAVPPGAALIEKIAALAPGAADSILRLAMGAAKRAAAARGSAR